VRSCAESGWRFCAGHSTKANQCSVTEYDTIVHKGEMQMPSVWFVYDMSPIAVTIRQTRRSLGHLLTRICAVIGGVFAMTGTLLFQNPNPSREP
jgi:hypothetical protein